MSSQPSWTANDAGGTPTPGDGADWLEDDVEAPSLVAEKAPIEKEASTEAATPAKKRWVTIALLVVSTLAFFLFVYSAAVQLNDGVDRLQWFFFYGISATIPGMFLFHYMCCFPDKLIYGISAAMACWSIVALIIASIDLSKTERGGAEIGGMTVHTQLVFEVGGSTLTLLSALYHAIMVKFCVGKKKKDEGGAAVMS
jgi:hypothetical protein